MWLEICLNRVQSDSTRRVFVKNNIDQLDMIALSGAHDIGVSNCNCSAYRVYNFCPSNPASPLPYLRQAADARRPKVHSPECSTAPTQLYLMPEPSGISLLMRCFLANSASQPTAINFFWCSHTNFTAAFTDAVWKLA
ncbi:hypothetical protein Ancab_030072 [Ancistrocladus abbreviatus]